MRPGWCEVSVGDICEFRYGKALPAQERSGSGFAVFGSNGTVGRHRAALTGGSTIVIGRKGSFGEVAFSPDPCWPIDTTYFVDESTTSADLRWLYYRLRSLPLKQLNRAAAIPGLNREDAYMQRLLLPPIEEQRQIAMILDAADALRAKRRQALAKLNALSQAVFIHMFGHPATNPMGWPTCGLADLGQLDRGVSRHRPRNDPALLGGAWPLIQTGDVANSGGYIRSFSSTYSDFGRAQSKLWPAGTLCITIAANIAKTGVLMLDACFPDSVVGFTSGIEGRSEYVRALLGFLQPVLEQQAPESAQKNINLQILRSLQVPRPPDSGMRTFSDAISFTNRIAERGNEQGRRLDALIASLQHRAFRGEL